MEGHCAPTGVRGIRCEVQSQGGRRRLMAGRRSRLKGRSAPSAGRGKLCRKLLNTRKNKHGNCVSLSPGPGGTVAAADLGGDERRSAQRRGGGATKGDSHQPCATCLTDVFNRVCRDVGAAEADVLGHLSSVGRPPEFTCSRGGATVRRYGPELGPYIFSGRQSQT